MVSTLLFYFIYCHHKKRVQVDLSVFLYFIDKLCHVFLLNGIFVCRLVYRRYFRNLIFKPVPFTVQNTFALPESGHWWSSVSRSGSGPNLQISPPGNQCAALNDALSCMGMATPDKRVASADAHAN